MGFEGDNGNGGGIVTQTADLENMNSSLGPGSGGTRTEHTGTGNDKRLDIKLGEDPGGFGDGFGDGQRSAIPTPPPVNTGIGIDWFSNTDSIDAVIVIC